MREMWFAAALGLTLGATLPAVAQAPSAPAAKVDAAKAVSLLTVTPDDRILGQVGAPITIVEYGSLTCPHCAHFATQVLPQIEKKWIDTGKARLVFRDFPLDQAALAAEMVARCAPPDRYYKIIDGLFRSQPDWVVEKDWKPALKGVARVLGVSGQQFDGCLANKTLEDKVAQSRLVASQQLDVQATPTFFINGKKFDGEPTVEGFDRVLSQAAS